MFGLYLQNVISHGSHLSTIVTESDWRITYRGVSHQQLLLAINLSGENQRNDLLERNIGRECKGNEQSRLGIGDPVTDGYWLHALMRIEDST
jgi:hypothetical protein